MQGIGYLALAMNLPIIPVKISGLFDILPINKTMPKKGKVIVKFGKPINQDKLKNISYIKATKLIEKKVKEL